MFLEYHDALRLQEVVNTIGTKRTIHKLGMFYYGFENVPRSVNSNMKSVHLLAAAYSQDVKRYGFEPVLRPFINEVKKLEPDGGYIFHLEI